MVIDSELLFTSAVALLVSAWRVLHRRAASQGLRLPARVARLPARAARVLLPARAV